MTSTAIDRGLSAELAEELAAAAFTLARRFAAGATMWSIAPGREPHAMHIAVEFVHPVIMGKRALPAVALTGPDLVDVVRVSARPGDIVIAVAGADDAQVRSVMRRGPRPAGRWRPAEPARPPGAPVPRPGGRSRRASAPCCGRPASWVRWRSSSRCSSSSTRARTPSSRHPRSPRPRRLPRGGRRRTRPPASGPAGACASSGRIGTRRVNLDCTANPPRPAGRSRGSPARYRPGTRYPDDDAPAPVRPL
ncbi:hypothetical protein BN971_04067 [Mycobacterium bohemicum DSM 44277]|uniref:Uncharacterized protein n=1 Tax=Mycobacterium bohemicum DSM 44277 TaxID=1236609 RepID=A0A0U0WDB6_MYCBE|nr:hypothetical protein BN971_04067 [Mycobacterium bohemicum DSM 44277]